MRTLQSMQILAEHVRGGVIERCGHWLAEERPDELSAQLLAFFGEETDGQPPG
jgi:pimeloyl-ACP methyl ester carboxylesterase